VSDSTFTQWLPPIQITSQEKNQIDLLAQTCTWCEGGCASSIYAAITKFCWAAHDVEVLSCNARVVKIKTNWGSSLGYHCFFFKLLALQEADLAGL